MKSLRLSTIAAITLVSALGFAATLQAQFVSKPLTQSTPFKQANFSQRIEAAIRKPLTPEQKQAITIVAHATMLNLLKAQAQFEQQVCQSSELALNAVQQPTLQQPTTQIHYLLRQLELQRGKPLTPLQKRQILEAHRNRAATIAMLREQLMQKIATITGSPFTPPERSS